MGMTAPARRIVEDFGYMKVLLTSCGLETEQIENTFKNMFNKPLADVKAVFIPTAANSPDAIEVLPKCLNDLLKVGITKENIFVYDLYDELDSDIYNTCDVIYLCGGNPDYLLRRINERGFNSKLLEFINNEGIVVGVSAGSIVFANNIHNNLGLLKCSLDVHCDDDNCEKAGSYPKDRRERIKLGNSQAIVFDGDDIVIID